MRCSECAAEVVADAVFCHQCGERLESSASNASPAERFQAAVGTDAIDDDPREQDLWQGNFSKRAMIGSWIGSAVFTLVMFVVAAVRGFSGTGWLGTLAVIILVWLALLARLFYRQMSDHYYLTDQRFVHERGLLWREINRIEAIDVDDVSFQQGPIERILGVGTISISSSDRSHPIMEMPGIENVREVAGMIDEARRQERRKRGLYVEAV